MSFIVNILIFLTLFIGAMYLAKNKLNISESDFTMMAVGVFSFDFIRDVSLMIGALIAGNSALPFFLGALISGGLAYYFYSRLR